MDIIGSKFYYKSPVYSAHYVSNAVVETVSVINALILFRISLFASLHLMLSPRSLDQCLDKELQNIQFSNDPKVTTKGVEVLKKMMVVSLKTSVAISLISTIALVTYGLKISLSKDGFSDRLSVGLGSALGCISGLKMRTYMQTLVRKNLITHLFKGIPTSQLSGVVFANCVGVSVAGTSSFLRTALY